MKGGLGGSQTTSQELPGYVTELAQLLSDRAAQTMQIGHQAYQGPTVAEFTPMQQASFAGVNSAAGAFGLPQIGDVGGHGGLDGMGKAQNFGGGLHGYGPAQGFNKARNAWAQQNPGQAQEFNALFANPKGQGNGNRRGGK